jgi:shikimate 5-dehydrogenase
MSSLFRMKTGELEADVVINATSLGMYPRDGESPIPKKLLKEEMMVMDIVYEPLETKLLREAKERGCPTINGLEMLVRQGVAQFEIWTGRKPEIGQIKKDLRRVLERKPTKPHSGRLLIEKR